MQTGSNSFKTILSILSAAVGVAAIVLIAGTLTTMSSQKASATMQFTQDTGKPCTFCHTAPPELNDQGKAFKANGNKL